MSACSFGYSSLSPSGEHSTAHTYHADYLGDGSPVEAVENLIDVGADDTAGRGAPGNIATADIAAVAAAGNTAAEVVDSLAEEAAGAVVETYSAGYQLVVGVVGDTVEEEAADGLDAADTGAHTETGVEGGGVADDDNPDDFAAVVGKNTAHQR